MDTLLVILAEEKLVGPLMKKNCEKQIKKSLELKKQLKENMINYMLNGKARIFNSWREKKNCVNE